MRIDLFFCGFTRLACPLQDATALFEALRRSGISPKALQRVEKTREIHFSCTMLSAKRLMREFPALPLRELRRGGLPEMGQRLLRRPGLLCGILLALLLTVSAHLFVWSVSVEGNDTVSTDALLSELSAAGLARGSFIPSVDHDAVVLSLRQQDSRIAYATVNLRGTVAHVQIRESNEKEAAPTAPADLIATDDGVVVMPLVFAGECLVREGDVVRAGQTLVSGAIESEKHGIRVTRAAGQILARTTHVYTVTVPFAYEEKVYTGRGGKELSLCFFDFQGIFFKTTGNIKGKYDIIQNKEWLTLSNGKQLPIGFALTQVAEYELRPTTRTALEAKALAEAELEAALAADSEGRILLTRTVEMQAGAEGLTLICTVVCEEDIARVAEFETGS